MNSVAQETERALFPPEPVQTAQVDLLDIFLVLAAQWRIIGIATLSSLLVGTLVILLLQPTYTATAVILPPQQQSSTAALMGQLGALASLGGGAGAIGLKSPADLYVGILESRTIQDEIIHRFGLQGIYKRRKMQDARLALKNHTEIEASKDGLIHISVTDHSPDRASDLANAYVSDLDGMNSKLAISEAAQRRMFFDQQLEGERKALTAAEEDLRATEQRTGIIQLGGQAELIIQTIGRLRAEIASREVELQAMRTFATEQNPDVARKQQELSLMHAQLTKMENDEQKQMPGDIAVPAGRVPEDSLEYARKLREVKYHETLFDLLSRQYEAARIDEAKSAPIIQVIDNAVPPDKKSGPHGSLILIGFGIVGFCGSSLASLFVVGLKNMQQTPEYAQKLNAIRNSVR